ncbi:MAG: hypothetical protein RIR70_2175 [Pseudomonadota bacterium]|jgi:hypothetical protein
MRISAPAIQCLFALTPASTANCLTTAKICQAYFSTDTRDHAPHYAPQGSWLRLSNTVAQEIFPAWLGSDADQEAHQIIRFFSSLPKSQGHLHRHWAFMPARQGEAGPFLMLDKTGHPMLARDMQVFDASHGLLPLTSTHAAGFYLHHSPHKTLHGFFDDRNLVADLYLRLLDPHHNRWLREHQRFSDWLTKPSDGPLRLVIPLQRPIGHVMTRHTTYDAQLHDAQCEDCVAVLRKFNHHKHQPDFYLATAYPLPRVN